MKSIYLLPCLLFINLSGVGWETDWGEGNEWMGYELPPLPRNCPEANCKSLRLECMQHNKRCIFSAYLLNKKASKEKTREETSVLPMLPEPLQHLIGSYAREIPTHYTIQHYVQEPKIEDFRLSGNLSLNADRTGMLLTQNIYSEAERASAGSYSITLTATETEFFRDHFSWSTIKADWVTYEVSERGIQFLISIRNERESDLVYLKPIQTDATKALKAAGLLSQKKKK